MRVSKGYTILEVLIFIAVSALIFVGTMVAINGRQQQVQFTQSVRDLETKLLDIRNDITTGYYASSDRISCVAPLNSGAPDIQEIFDLTQDSPQGTSDSCIYVGKAVQFVNTSEGAQLNIINLVGRRFTSGNANVESLAQSEPSPVATIDEPSSSVLDSTIEQYRLRFGLRVTEIFDDPVNQFGAISFTNKFALNGGGTPINQSQFVDVAGVTGTRLDSSKGVVVGALGDLTDDTSDPARSGFVDIAPSTDLVVCVVGTGGQRASITLLRTSGSGVRTDFDTYNTECDFS